MVKLLRTLFLYFEGDFHMRKRFVHYIQAIFVAIIFLVIGGTVANADSANLTDGSYTCLLYTSPSPRDTR